jgi:hypothetical protein
MRLQIWDDNEAVEQINVRYCRAADKFDSPEEGYCIASLPVSPMMARGTVEFSEI